MKVSERKKPINLPFRVTCPSCTTYMIVHVFQGGMVPVSDFPTRQCIVCGKTGLRIEPADLEGTATKVWNDADKRES